MTPQFAKPQALEEIYELLRRGAAGRQPVAAIYDGLPRLLCPHVLGRNREGRLRAFCYQFGGSSGSSLRLGPEGVGGWRCIAVDKLSEVELQGAPGAPSHEPAISTASRRSISTLTLSPRTTRKKGSEEVGAATGAPARYGVSRWSSDYAARPVRGDPRGRKFGVGPGAANPRYPERAEGEKRLRSAIRNP